MKEIKDILFLIPATAIGFSLIIYMAIINNFLFGLFLKENIDPQENEGKRFLLKLASILFFTGFILLFIGKILALSSY